METVARLCCLFLGDRAFLPPAKLKAKDGGGCMDDGGFVDLWLDQCQDRELVTSKSGPNPLFVESAVFRSRPSCEIKNRHVPPNQMWKDYKKYPENILFLGLVTPIHMERQRQHTTLCD